MAGPEGGRKGIDDPKRLTESEKLALDALEAAGSSLELDRIFGEINARKGDSAATIPPLETCGKAGQLDAEGLLFLGTSYLETEQENKCREKLEKALAAGLPEGLTAEVPEHPSS